MSKSFSPEGFYKQSSGTTQSRWELGWNLRHFPAFWALSETFSPPLKNFFHKGRVLFNYLWTHMINQTLSSNHTSAQIPRNWKYRWEFMRFWKLYSGVIETTLSGIYFAWMWRTLLLRLTHLLQYSGRIKHINQIMSFIALLEKHPPNFNYFRSCIFKFSLKIWLNSLFCYVNWVKALFNFLWKQKNKPCAGGACL
jgi:hypothetical protein